MVLQGSVVGGGDLTGRYRDREDLLVPRRIHKRDYPHVPTLARVMEDTFVGLLHELMENKSASHQRSTQVRFFSTMAADRATGISLAI